MATATITGHQTRESLDAPSARVSPLRHLNPTAVSAAAKIESRNREVHLPPVSIYRWWARRTAAVNGAIIDAFAQDHPGKLLIADVFAGGGVIPLAAAVRNHQVYAQDLNPWAATGLAAMLGLPTANSLREAYAAMRQWIDAEVSAAYGTTLSDGTSGLVSHTFRVATAECTNCHVRARLFPHAMVTLLARRERDKPEAFLACPEGHLFAGDSSEVNICPQCKTKTDPDATYTARRQVVCRSCKHEDRLEQRAGTWQWEIVLVERSGKKKRELALPSTSEIEAADHERWQPSRQLGAIPEGQETKVLLRHGFTTWDDLYPRRQRYLLERILLSAQSCSQDAAVVQAMSMAVIGSAEMAGHVSRWDRYYLKSYESMAGHRFNLTTLTVEPNAWGTHNSGRGTVLRRINQLIKAAEWFHKKTAKDVSVEGPLFATAKTPAPFTDDVRVVEGSSETILLPDGVVDLVLTDPPYHDDVQYSELSRPFRAWANIVDGPLWHPQMDDGHLSGEAVVNGALGQLTEDGAYGGLLQRIFTEVRRTLKPSGHLVFSYANRSPSAWVEVFNALQAAGFRASGCEIVHSENETDHAKRGVRACTLDLILDLVVADETPIEPHHPRTTEDSIEVTFLRIVADTFAKIGSLPTGWEKQFQADLASTAFLAGPKKAKPAPPEKA
ncbi:hypothetical protein [Catellatospora vulcania]|uniref:hypothetical protein n=1 Tax=Catellatospora vulcania TaxID=1460450 RepID=UPI0012D4891D|nr:hypothetical protein [Catellatospora vulcania]